MNEQYQLSAFRWWPCRCHPPVRTTERYLSGGCCHVSRNQNCVASSGFGGRVDSYKLPDGSTRRPVMIVTKTGRTQAKGPPPHGSAESGLALVLFCGFQVDQDAPTAFVIFNFSITVLDREPRE